MKKKERCWFLANPDHMVKQQQSKLKRVNKRYDISRRNTKIRSIGTTPLVSAPRFISIYSGSDDDKKTYQQTLHFRDRLQEKLGPRPIIIDFSETMDITAAALVMLYATIDSCCKNGVKASIRWSKNSPKTNALIKQSNFDKLARGLTPSQAIDGARALPVISGIGNHQVDDILDFIKGRIYSDVGMNDATEHLYGDAVTETINNVSRHAYPETDAFSRKWWLMCDVVGDNLYLAIFDTGVGIPKTVVKRRWFAKHAQEVYPEQCRIVQELSNDKSSLILRYRLADEDLIHLSMLGDVTGTHEAKHGQGSKSIKALVSETEGGKLWVFSNKGLLTYESEGQDPILYKLPVSLSGTLVQWNIKIR